MSDIIARIPDAVDLEAETTRNNLRWRVMTLVRLMQNKAQAGEREVIYQAPFNQNVIDVFTGKGYTISHDGTSYTIGW